MLDSPFRRCDCCRPMPPPTHVIMPASPSEAMTAFGTSDAVTLVGGATIVTPALRAGTIAPERVMLLTGAGLDRIHRDGDRLRIGATVRLSELAALAVGAPLAAAAGNVADAEIRAQATVAGNICAGPGRDAPRGDLQGALIALDAVVVWTDGAEKHWDRIETFLWRAPKRRLVLEIEVSVPERGGFQALRRPHSHGYTALAVSGAVVGGQLRLAVTGLFGHGVSLRSAQDPEPVVPPDADPDPSCGDDALTSGGYRREMVPVLARRCVAEMEVTA